MRILCVSPYYKPAHIYGGPVNSISILCEAFAKKGHDVTVFTTNANGTTALPVTLDQPLSVDGVNAVYFERYHILPDHYFFAPAMAPALSAQIHGFDVVYACTTWTYPMTIVARAASRAAIPYIVSPRGDFMDWSMSQNALKKRLYLNLVERKNVDRSAGVHCTSQMEIDQMEHLNLRPVRVLIPNGVDLARFRGLPPRGLLRRKLNIPLSSPVSLFVGRLQAMKRIEDTVKIFLRVLESVPAAHLLIAGEDEDGSGRHAMRQVDNSGFQSRIHFLGALYGQDLLQAYSDADLLILLSHRENFSMVAVEAMAAKLPVIISDRVAIWKEVVEAGAGYAIDPDGSHPEEKWIALLTDPEKRYEMGGKALELVQRDYSVDRVADQMLEFFNRVIRA